MVGVDYKLAGRQRKRGRSMPKVGGRKSDRINMTGWDPEIITPEEQNLAKPLVQVARLVFSLVKVRVFKQHRSAKGKSFGQYSNRPLSRKPGNLTNPEAYSEAIAEEGAQGHYWISPNMTRGVLSRAAFVVQRGKWKGWAAFRSYRDYMIAKGRGADVSLFNTGTFAQGLQLRPMGPMKIRLSFYGGRRKATNTVLGGSDRGGRRSSQAKNNRDLARILSKKYGPIIDLSSDDMRKVNALVGALFTPALVDMLKLAQVSVTARKKLRTRKRALAKVEREFREAQAAASGARNWDEQVV